MRVLFEVALKQIEKTALNEYIVKVGIQLRACDSMWAKPADIALP